jgi:PsbN protein
MERYAILINFMEPATVLIISVATTLLAVTGFAVYTSFGPPAKHLTDPFEEHED